jgi:hypothetical protein
MALATYLPRTFAQGKDGCGRQAGTHPGQRRRRAGLLVSGPRRFEQRPSGAQPWMVSCHVAPCPRRRERARGVARWVVGSYPPAAAGGHKRGARSPLGRGIYLVAYDTIPSHPILPQTIHSIPLCVLLHQPPTTSPHQTRPRRTAPTPAGLESIWPWAPAAIVRDPPTRPRPLPGPHHAHARDIRRARDPFSSALQPHRPHALRPCCLFDLSAPSAAAL